MTESQIRQFQNMLRNKPHEDKGNIMRSVFATHKLTRDAIIEFQEFINPESFSKSYDLTWDIINSYKEYFDINLWEDSPNKTVEPLKHKEFRDIYYPDTPMKNIIEKLQLIVTNEYVFDLMNDDSNDNIYLLSIVRGTVDEIKLKELVIKHPEYLTQDVLKNPYVSHVYGKEVITTIIKNKETLNIKDIITLMSRSTTSEIKEIFKGNHNFEFNDNMENVDSILVDLFSNMNDEMFEDLFKFIYDNFESTYNYNNLSLLIETRGLSENIIKQYENLLKSRGVYKLANEALKVDALDF